MVGEKSVASMVDVGGIRLPWGPVASILPRMGVAVLVRRCLRGRRSDLDLGPLLHGQGPRATGDQRHPRARRMSQQLSIVSTLINANVPTRVWEVNLSSFDTHTGEKSPIRTPCWPKSTRRSAPS